MKVEKAEGYFFLAFLSNEEEKERKKERKRKKQTDRLDFSHTERKKEKCMHKSALLPHKLFLLNLSHSGVLTLEM